MSILDSLDLDKDVKLGVVSAMLSESINKHLFGEILTIVDASSKDVESRKAIKSLVSQAFTRNTNSFLLGLDKIYGGKK